MARVGQILINEGWLVLAALIGAGIGLLLQRWLRDPAAGRKSGLKLFSDIMTYVSTIFGIMLGLMLLFTVQHFTSTASHVRDEARAISDIFESVQSFPAEVRAPVERDAVCLMRSIATDSWAAAQRADLSGDMNTTSWWNRIRGDVGALPAVRPIDEGSQAVALNAITEGINAGQTRLLSAPSTLPGVVWFVIDLGMCIFAALIFLSFPGRPRTAVVGLGLALVLTMGVVFSLGVFAEPFTDLGVSVKPTAIQGTMMRLQSAYPGAEWQPCERLAPAD